MRAVTAVAFALGLALAGPSVTRANSVYTTDCSDPVDFRTTFATTDHICVTGDVDYTCRSGIISLPGVDIYVMPTGGPPFSGIPVSLRDILGGAGSFLDEPLWDPPLAPGTYDLVLDEHCNGVWDAGDDLRVDRAFTVGTPMMCELPPGTRPVDEGIPNSGALCRGACGSDCPGVSPGAAIGACLDTTVALGCTDVAACMHTECRMRTLSCGSHQGCRDHDACYDDCARAGSPFTPPAGNTCTWQCDVGCLGRYGMLCNSWRQGGGPFDMLMGFAYPPAVVTAPGLCSGGPC